MGFRVVGLRFQILVVLGLGFRVLLLWAECLKSPTSVDCTSDSAVSQPVGVSQLRISGYAMYVRLDALTFMHSLDRAGHV